MNRQIAFTFLCLLIGDYGVSSIRNMREIASWKELDFVFPSRRQREYAIANGLFVRGNGVPIDVDVHYGRRNGRVFVTVPRFTTGIPFSLGTISNIQGDGGPQLTPYPSYDWHSSHGQNCDGITSVFRVAIDECQRIWVLDTGMIGDTQYCPPQLLVFNLRHDRLLLRYKFPEGQYISGQSLFVTPIVDVLDARGNCNNVNVYIADVTGYGIVVYSSRLNTSWRVQNNLTMSNPESYAITVAGETFEIMDGILGMSLSPKNARKRYLYFHALASVNENRVPLSVLNDQSIWLDNANASPDSFSIIGQRQVQSAAEAMDKNGNLFFGLMDPISIASWNTDKPYTQENIKIVSRNNETLQFASGVKVISNPRTNKQELWVLTCRFQKIMLDTKDSNEVNFRIQGCLVDDLLKGSTCSGEDPIESNFIFN